MKIAYQGEPGAFSEAAGRRVAPDAELLPCKSFEEVFAAVEGGQANYGILPIENSIGGSIHRNYDLLVTHELPIQAEIELPVVHQLLALPGTTIARLRRVYSHPQALGQCRRFLERCFPKAQLEAALSTTAAVEQMLSQEGAAAIATRRAAEIYGAQVLARGIQDNPSNKTRFVVLTPHDCPPTGRDKTSIAFTVAHDRPGTLVNVLHEFSDRQINLTKIESRPSKEELGVYIFLVDMDGHRADPPVAEALERVREQAFFFKVFGSYPRYVPAA